MFRRTRSILVGLALAAALLAPASLASAQDAPAPVTIRMQDNKFLPDKTTVPVGTAVTWTNLDGEQHDVLTVDGVLSSPLIDPDGDWTFAFTDPGVYEYFCDLHDNMIATIEVAG